MSSETDARTIEDQRAKTGMWFTEDCAPGLKIEAELHRILVNTQSEFQKVSVIETYFGKTLVTDGKTQSAQLDEFAYHESLVHPALLQFCRQQQGEGENAGAPVGPKTIFIGGGGELATARECLRYGSVERVVMVDLDAKVVEVCKKYLPEWGGDTVTSDPRMELIIGDAYKWLMETEETFDVIVMDISDPIEAGPGIMLYVKEFYEHAVTRLNDGGVFVTQAGTAEAVPASHFIEGQTDSACYGPVRNTLQTVFENVVPYSSNIPSFGGDWGFVMAFNGHVGQEEVLSPKAGLIDGLIQTHIKDELKYYDQTTHSRMFNLTKPLRKSLEADKRIMTKDNPIFMF